MELSGLPEEMRAHIQRFFFNGLRHSLVLWRQIEGYQCCFDNQTLGVRTNFGWFVVDDHYYDTVVVGANLPSETTTRVPEKCTMSVRLVNPENRDDYWCTRTTEAETDLDLDAFFLKMINLIRYKKKGAMHRTIMAFGPVAMEMVQHF